MLEMHVAPDKLLKNKGDPKTGHTEKAHFPHVPPEIPMKLSYLRITRWPRIGPRLTFTSYSESVSLQEIRLPEKSAEGPRMCMKTKGEKSDILEGPRMLMKNKQLNELSCR